MFIQIFVLCLAVLITACSGVFSQTPKNVSLSMCSKVSMNSPSIISPRLRLIAREERLPPVGIPAQLDRNIGFADIFIRLDNPKDAKIQLVLEKIEICDVSHDVLQNFSFLPQTIELKPLENSELVFHLKNKTGYAKKGKVKAILRYRFENKEYVIESDAVAIISH
jgi:hypothetical protein